MTTLRGITCLNCGAEVGTDIMVSACPHCGLAWLDAVYDYPLVANLWRDGLNHREQSLWRYRELLPLPHFEREITMGEGYTSLVRLYPYERLYPGPQIYIKDERQGPTSSFKDRQAALAVMAMVQHGITECALASTGNAGVAYAAYCARAGIRLWLFLAGQVPDEKMREAILYGAEVIKVAGTYDEAKKVADEFAQHRGIYLDKGAKTIPSKESMKTLAYEIAEQLGLAQTDDGSQRWYSPDWYVQAVSGGIGPLGVWKGFSELYRMGLVDRMPRLAIVQVAGCAPMVDAFKANSDIAKPVIPHTLITVLATGDPGYSYNQLREAVLSNKGTMLAVEDGETFQAMRRLASKAGLSVEPATAVAFAGLEKLLADGTIGDGETVVVNCSGHTFPVESHILGDQFAINLSLDTARDISSQVFQPSNLKSAFDLLDEQVTTVLIVDDNSQDMRLIRRLVERHKKYRVLEAHHGEEALTMVRDYRPNLVVTDLTMPTMDGFELIESLKSTPATAHIPVTVVSAKTLTLKEKDRLNKLGATVWTKGGFDTRQLVQHIVKTLGHDAPQVSGDWRERTATPYAPLSNYSPVTSAKFKILVIDDNPYDAKLIKRMLRNNPQYLFIEASNGRDGLKAAYTYHPDLILLDFMLPDMDGLYILDMLKRNRELAAIPIIVISARENPFDPDHDLSHQIESILMKTSFTSSELADLVKKTLHEN